MLLSRQVRFDSIEDALERMGASINIQQICVIYDILVKQLQALRHEAFRYLL
jgi:hypothetical protein